MRLLSAFLREERGAVTVDWVAVTASVLLLGILVVYAVFSFGVSATVNDVNSTMKSVSIDIAIPAGPDFND